MEHQPIKRHPAIAPLSREHHLGLLLCWKIRHGVKHNIAPGRIAAYVLHFFESDLKAHFDKEEQALFEKMAGDPLVVRAVREHGEIYEVINGIKAGVANYQTLQQFADKLDAHIRFEERTLFNHLQSQLAEAELLEISRHIEEKACDIDGGWGDHFWNVK